MIPRRGFLLLGVLSLLGILALSLIPRGDQGRAASPASVEVIPLGSAAPDTLSWPEDPMAFLEGIWSGSGTWPDGTPFAVRSSFRSEGPHGYLRYEVVDISVAGAEQVLWTGIMYRHEGSSSLLLMDEGRDSSPRGARRVLAVEVEPGSSVGIVPGRDARVLLFRSGADEVTSVVEVPGNEEPWREMARFVHSRQPPPRP